MIDLADIVVTYLKELYPMAFIEKTTTTFVNEAGVFVIEINGNHVGITVDDFFATWDKTVQKAVLAKATDKDFFDIVLHWAILKGKLNPGPSPS